MEPLLNIQKRQAQHDRGPLKGSTSSRLSLNCRTVDADGFATVGGKSNMQFKDDDFVDAVIGWYQKWGRDFPWRKPILPFHALAAEVMLQRTRAEQVEPVFEAFVAAYNDPYEVIKAGKGYVDEMFGMLGLRWRAALFFEAMQTLAAKFNGNVPSSINGLMSLPGVGLYSATAISVFVYGRPGLVVDANVLRVLGCWFEVKLPDHVRRSSTFHRALKDLTPEDPARCKQLNWGLLDIAAAQRKTPLTKDAMRTFLDL
jgi:A/G-specific adenine glycosylase